MTKAAGWQQHSVRGALAGALLVLVAASVVVYFGVAWMVGAVDRQRIATLTKKAS